MGTLNVYRFVIDSFSFYIYVVLFIVILLFGVLNHIPL